MSKNLSIFFACALSFSGSFMKPCCMEDPLNQESPTDQQTRTAAQERIGGPQGLVTRHELVQLPEDGCGECLVGGYLFGGGCLFGILMGAAIFCR